MLNVDLLWLSLRGGQLVSSASVGTFLIGLGIDLIINDLDGWSRGLRFLFDRNTAHLAVCSSRLCSDFLLLILMALDSHLLIML